MLPTVPLSNYKEHSQVKGSNKLCIRKRTLTSSIQEEYGCAHVHACTCLYVHGKELHFWAFILKYPNQYALLEKHMIAHAKL